ncbi:MAG: ribonuclease P [Candidatus Bathyarchaeia archaeon]|nr:ribonuclease P [Candidatus Bathyarchaeota archaeon]
MNDNLRKIALERVKILFRLALENANCRPDLAQKYVKLAMKISSRARVHLPREYRIQVCKYCKRFILPGTTSQVRIQPRREPHIVLTCSHCGGITRIPLKRKETK